MKPDFIIAGAAKSGTSSLAYNLNCHPDLFMPPKEIHYFSKKPNLGDNWYLSHFRQHDKTSGEKSTSYLYYTQCHQRMYDLIPDAKIIILLRNPVDRAYSNWNMRYNDRRIIKQGLQFNKNHSCRLKSLDFSAIVDFYLDNRHNLSEEVLFQPPLDIVHRGLYINQLESLLQYYSIDMVRILITEEYFADERFNFSNLCEFLKLSSNHPKTFVGCNIGQYSNPIPPRTRLRLRNFYRPFNNRLFQFFNSHIAKWE